MTSPFSGAATALAGFALIGCGVAACTPVGTAVGGAAVVTRSVIQERSTKAALDDTAIAIGVNANLGQTSGELFRDVSVDVTEGEVVLTGSVPRAEDKVAATEAAWRTPGVTGVTDAMTVAEDAGTRAYLEDLRISNTVRYGLLTDLDVGSLNYTVTTVDRVVHLTGIARTPEELGRVIEIARSVDGVVRVVSHVLTIDDPRRVRRLAKSG